MVIGGQEIPLSSLADLIPSVISDHVNTANSQAMTHGLADSSFRAYAAAWNSWLRWATFYGFSADCLDANGYPLEINPPSISGTYLPGITNLFYDAPHQQPFQDSREP